jgi:hypothetical protein
MENNNTEKKYKRIEVGKSLIEGVDRYQEGIHFVFTEIGASLAVFCDKPTKQVIKDIRIGNIKIAMKERDDILFIIAKFRTSSWMVTPFNMNLYMSSLGVMREPTEGSGYLLNTLLVDASNGIVKVIRVTGLPTEFSKEFRNAIELQSHLPFDINAYFKKIDALNNYNITKDLFGQTITVYEIASAVEMQYK